MGTNEFPWMDFVAVCATVRPGDPLFDAEFPEAAGWDKHAMLLATIADGIHVLAWQNGKRRRSEFPKQIPRPGVEEKSTRVFGGRTIEYDDAQAFLDRKRAGHPAA